VARTQRITFALAIATLAGCTPGGVATSGISGGGGGAGVPAAINVSLSAYPASSIPPGMSGGFSPAISTLAVGSSVRFTNTDTFAHTATAIPGATTFPAGSPFSASAQNASGTSISSAWSSGTLQAGQSSQTLTIDKPGTYLFGCFFHYGAPMRGEIVAL
jgi:plastocyanin